MKNKAPQQARLAVAYTRVSTVEQAAGGISLAAQRSRIEGYCLAHDLRLLKVCTDEGVSGRKRVNRPGLSEAVELVCSKKGVLIAHSLSGQSLQLSPMSAS